MSWEAVLKNETQHLDKLTKLTKEIYDKIVGNFEKGIWYTTDKAYAQDLHDVVNKLNEVAGLIDNLNFSRKNV